jgi:hypothetical protein
MRANLNVSCDDPLADKLSPHNSRVVTPPFPVCVEYVNGAHLPLAYRSSVICISRDTADVA